MSRFTQLRTGVLTAEPGSASFHCQTFFLEVRPPSQGASCWEHSPPTPPPQRAWPRKEFKAGSGDPAASVEAAPPRAGSGCVPSPLSHLPCHVFRLRRQGLSSGQLPAAGLWVTEQGNPGLCARSGAFLRVPAQGTGQEGALGESLARVPPASSSPPGPLRGPRGRRTSPPSLCPLQGLSCPKDHAEAPSATRATSRAPPETQEGRRDHDRPSLHRRGRAPGAQRFPKVLLPLGESPRTWGRGRAAAPALRNFGARPRGRKWGTRGRGRRAWRRPHPAPGRAPAPPAPRSRRAAESGSRAPRAELEGGANKAAAARAAQAPDARSERPSGPLSRAGQELRRPRGAPSAE